MSSIVDSIAPAAKPKPASCTAFGCARDFDERRYVYTVISPRAGGLSIGVNLNPTRCCNFNCLYCEVPNRVTGLELPVDIEKMMNELRDVMTMVSTRKLHRRPYYHQLPEGLLELKHISLSGDGEPTLSPNFLEVVQSLVHFRALRMFPFFKLVLITNASKLMEEDVANGIELLEDRQDEVWVKLDVGDQERFQKINGTSEKLDALLQGILGVAKKRPVVIQSLQTAINGVGPTPKEVDQLIARICELRKEGAKIASVQIYSATRPVWNTEVGHLKLNNLSAIAQAISKKTGVRAVVY
ncbi:MAG: radical SAM protein [Verrucomicrobia bacterium]|jgi:wyosine [tRNA(Phe)-imidazoG37] synthetase (radical SAM superfamily)|nr:radical SAM protein [Verrucomicrobiota bacterium]